MEYSSVEMKMPIIQKTNKGQFIITLPKIIVELKDWKKGTKILFILDNLGNLILKEIR